MHAGTFIMGGADEVQALLDDQIVKTQSMLASPFIKPLEATARTWEGLMTTLQDIVDNWLQVGGEGRVRVCAHGCGWWVGGAGEVEGAMGWA